MRDDVHEIDIVGDVYPVKCDMGKKFLYAQLLEVVVILLQQTAIGTHSIDDSCH